MKIIGPLHLKIKRNRKHLTLCKVSIETNIPENMLIEMEQGIYSGNIEALIKYARFLEIEIDLLQEGVFPQFDELETTFDDDREVLTILMDKPWKE